MLSQHAPELVRAFCRSPGAVRSGSFSKLQGEVIKTGDVLVEIVEHQKELAKEEQKRRASVSNIPPAEQAPAGEAAPPS